MDNKDTTAINNGQPVATAQTVPSSTTTTVDTTEDVEAKLAKLEEERDNYKKAFLKEKGKNKQDDDQVDETEDERIERIVQQKIIQSKIDAIDNDKEELLKKLARENKELKLANLNKTNTPPASVGSHSEGTPVTDTTITADQMAYFKSKNWTDKDIERYKKNLQRNTRG